MRKIITWLIWVGAYLAVGFAIGQVTQGSITTWYAALNKPNLNPPNYIFPIAWSILYVMIASAGWKIWQSSHTSKDLKWLFIGYTILNWAWTPIFFGAHQIFLALIWIVLLNLVAIIFIVKSWTVDKIAASLMIPPLLWTCFALYLNYAIYALN
jgi:tryptophan-rich sensory protein